MKNLLCLILCLLLILPPLPAQAWSEGGHLLIVVMAFRQLDKGQQAELIRILKAHPRFAEDIRLPKKVRNEDEWLIGRAGYWPDVARSQPEYNRPDWHYQLGSCLVIGKCEVPSCPEGATLETNALHIGQALNMCTESYTTRTGPTSNVP